MGYDYKTLGGSGISQHVNVTAGGGLVPAVTSGRVISTPTSTTGRAVGAGNPLPPPPPIRSTNKKFDTKTVEGTHLPQQTNVMVDGSLVANVTTSGLGLNRRPVPAVPPPGGILPMVTSLVDGGYALLEGGNIFYGTQVISSSDLFLDGGKLLVDMDDNGGGARLQVGGGGFFGGTVTATNFVGDGSGLTDINIDLLNGKASATAATPNTIVARDGSGDFAANVITAASLVVSGQITGSFTGINASSITAGTLDNARTSGTSANNANTLVLRDASGNFNAGNITLSASLIAATVNLGATATAQKLWIYNNGNARYGFGALAGGEFRSFAGVTSSNTGFTWGALSTSDGSTFTEQMRLSGGGRLLVGRTLDDSVGRVQSQAPSGGFVLTGADSSTDAAAKSFRLGATHFTNSEEPLTLLVGAATGATTGYVAIGGGTASGNAVQEVRFYTAANATTVTGTQAGTIDSSQRWILGGTADDGTGARLQVNGNVSISGTITSSGGGLSGTSLIAQGTTPVIDIYDTDGSVDQRRFRIGIAGNALTIDSRNDALVQQRVLASWNHTNGMLTLAPSTGTAAISCNTGGSSTGSIFLNTGAGYFQKTPGAVGDYAFVAAPVVSDAVNTSRDGCQWLFGTSYWNGTASSLDYIIVQPRRNTATVGDHYLYVGSSLRTTKKIITDAELVIGGSVTYGNSALTVRPTSGATDSGIVVKLPSTGGPSSLIATYTPSDQLLFNVLSSGAVTHQGAHTISAYTSTSSFRTQYMATPSWIDSTDATRKGRITMSVVDTAAREFLRADSTGSGSQTRLGGSDLTLASQVYVGALDPRAKSTVYMTSAPGESGSDRVAFWAFAQHNLTVAGPYLSAIIGRTQLMADATTSPPELRGVRAQVDVLSTATLTVPSIKGHSSLINNQSPSTVTNAYNFLAEAPTGGGPIAAAYGLYLQAQKATGVTTGYGVYQAGASDINAFLGLTQLGYQSGLANDTNTNVFQAQRLTNPIGSNGIDRVFKIVGQQVVSSAFSGNEFISAGTFRYTWGGNFNYTNTGTNNVIEVLGGTNGSGNKTVGALCGIQFHFRNSGTGVISRYQNVRIEDAFGSETTIYLSGIAVADQTKGTNNSLLVLGSLADIVGDWSIYSSNTKPSYFAGKVGIGTNSIGSTLSVIDTDGATVSIGTNSVTVNAADVLGTIDFKAPSEGSGGTAIGAGAQIRALAAVGFTSVSGAATDLVFNTYQSGVGLGERLRIASTGNVGIGTNSPARALDIVATNTLQFRLRSSAADATLKNGYVQVGHYTNSEEDLCMMLGQCGSSSNEVWVGGGSGSLNAATSIKFYTASTHNTLTGTERMLIDPNGRIGIGGAVNTSYLLTVNGATRVNGTLGVLGATSAYIAFNSPPGNPRDFAFQSSGVERWVMRVTSTAESGSNSGSDFQLIARDDSGTLLSVPLSITRSTGHATFSGNVISSGSFYAANGSVSNPSIRFNASGTTGIYRSGADEIGFVSAGSNAGRFDATGRLLLGASVDDGSGAKFQVAVSGTNPVAHSHTVTMTDPTANNRPYNFVTVVNATANNVQYHTGLQSHMTLTPSASMTMSGESYADRSHVRHNGAGTVATMSCYYANWELAAGSTANTIIGFWAKPYSALAGTVTTQQAFRAATPSLTGAGAITTAQGLYIEAQKVTGVTTGYGIHQAGVNDLNLFVGKTDIGGSPSTLSGNHLFGVQWSPTINGDLAAFVVQTVANPAANHTASVSGADLQGGTAVGNAFTFGTVQGAVARVVHRGTAQISNVNMLRATSPSFSSTGTISASTGVYIDSQKVTGVTTGYGIYQNGSADANFFSGQVRVGANINLSGAAMTLAGSGFGDGSVTGTVGVHSTANYNASPVAGITFVNKNTSGGAYAGMGGITVGKENALDNDTAGYLALHTRPAGGNNTERLRINSTGLVSVVGNITAKQVIAGTQTLTDGTTVAWNLDSGAVGTVTLADNRTLAAPTNIKAGATYYLIVKQDGTGSRTLTFDAVYKFPGGVAPTLSTAPNATDIFTFVSDGTNLFAMEQKAF
jgi:hypothetical protein